MVHEVLEKRAIQPKLKVSYDSLVDAVSGEYRTLQDIGNQFGVTRERIRQVQEIALFKMKNMMTEYENSGEEIDF